MERRVGVSDLTTTSLEFLASSYLIVFSVTLNLSLKCVKVRYFIVRILILSWSVLSSYNTEIRHGWYLFSSLFDLSLPTFTHSPL